MEFPIALERQLQNTLDNLIIKEDCLSDLYISICEEELIFGVQELIFALEFEDFRIVLLIPKMHLSWKDGSLKEIHGRWPSVC